MPAALLWEWDPVAEKWVKVPACVRLKRVTGAGQVVSGARSLYWISCNPDAAASEWELTDDLTGETDVVLDHHHPLRSSHNTNFIPPAKFSTGIYLKTYTNMTSITFGYV